MKSSGNVVRETFIRRIVKDLGLFCYPPSVSKHFFLLLYFFFFYGEKKVLGGTPRAFLCNKKVKQRACLGSSWTRQSADIITSAGRWRLYALWGLSRSFFLSVKPLSMQKGPITGWTIMIPSPLLMFHQEFNNSTGFYLSVLNYGKISKTSFPSEYGYLIAQMGPFFPSLKTMKVGHVI